VSLGGFVYVLESDVFGFVYIKEIDEDKKTAVADVNLMHQLVNYAALVFLVVRVALYKFRDKLQNLRFGYPQAPFDFDFDFFAVEVFQVTFKFAHFLFYTHTQQVIFSQNKSVGQACDFGVGVRYPYINAFQAVLARALFIIAYRIVGGFVHPYGVAQAVNDKIGDGFF
jgi:hypothetical protein